MKLISPMKLFFGLFLFPILMFAADTVATSPVGLWKTVDDVTGKPRSLVRVTEHDGVYDAVIEKILPIEGVVDEPNCSKCTGDKKDQPVVGMKFMWDMKADGEGKFNGGKILDPKNGSTYKCSVHLEPGGDKLTVRGYIGISLFGRSQTWTREAEASKP